MNFQVLILTRQTQGCPTWIGILPLIFLLCFTTHYWTPSLIDSTCLPSCLEQPHKHNLPHTNIMRTEMKMDSLTLIYTEGQWGMQILWMQNCLSSNQQKAGTRCPESPASKIAFTDGKVWPEKKYLFTAFTLCLSQRLRDRLHDITGDGLYEETCNKHRAGQSNQREKTWNDQYTRLGLPKSEWPQLGKCQRSQLFESDSN